MKVFPKKFTLNVFGKKVQVKVIDGMKDQGMMGLFNPNEKEWKILISTEQSIEDAIKSLIHEVIHSMIHRTGIDQALSGDLNEVISENVSTVICENFNLTLKR